jgi:hypothetical protein
MNRSITDFLPRALPFNEVRSSDEITYKTYDDGDGGFVPEREYTLEKAPINRVREVRATVDGSRKTLVEDVDWKLENNTDIVFLEDGEAPDPETTFTVEYTAESILSRFIESVEEETEKIDETIGIDSELSSDNNTVVSSKYIETAGENELDEIGKLFGPLGRRAGRSESRYRTYLKSIAKVYNGRGTKDSLAGAVSTVVSSANNTVGRDEISFKENFVRNEYGVKFNSFESHEIGLLYDIAEIADPSGVKFIGPVYDTGTDATTAIEGPKISLDQYDEFDSQSQVPPDFINPVGRSEEVPEVASIFTDDSESEEVLRREFEWAHQQIDNVQPSSGGDWSQFQWGEEDWSSQSDSSVTIVGPDWNFADWNFIESQATFDLRESVGVVDKPTSTISDSSPSDQILIDDSTQESYYRSIDSEQVALGDSGTIQPKIDSAEQIGSDDTPTVKTNNTNGEIAGVADQSTISVTERGWGASWSELTWAIVQ